MPTVLSSRSSAGTKPAAHWGSWRAPTTYAVHRDHEPTPAPPRRGAAPVGQFPSWEGSGWVDLRQVHGEENHAPISRASVLSSIHHVLRFAVQEGADIRDGDLHEPCACRARGPGDVWRDDAVLRA